MRAPAGGAGRPRWASTAPGAAGGTVQLGDARTGGRIGQPLMHFNGTGGSVAISPNGELVAASVDTTVRVWDRRSRRPVGRPLPPGHDGFVTGIAFSGDGDLL